MSANIVQCYNSADHTRQLTSISQLMEYSTYRSLLDLRSRLKEHGIWSTAGVEEICALEDNRDPTPGDVKGVFLPFALLMDTLLQDKDWRRYIPTDQGFMKITA